MLLLDPNPPNFPSDAAVAWGEDAYGLWQAIAINGVRQIMRWIPPGQFWMGSPETEPERRDNETQHLVTLSQGFWLAETACTQALWQAVMSKNPACFDSDLENPVENVNWHDCQDFISKANQQLPADIQLRLPIEAEWEYACRARPTSDPNDISVFSWGDELTADLANYDGKYPYAGDHPEGEDRRKTLPVLSFKPNAWGLYQMHGNVWEWCADWLGDYPAEPMVDPAGARQGHGRVLRGGDWFDGGCYLRSAYRGASPPGGRVYIGLRLAGG